MANWCKKTLLASTLALGLGSVTTPAHAFLDSEKAWNDLLQFAVRQINAPGEFEIELGKVTKPKDGFALISSLRIRDADGIWLDANGLLVDWNPTSLLRGRFVFETLSADEINVLRAPIGRGDPPGEEAQIDFAWPRPPVTMIVETMLIKRMIIAGGLLPQDFEARIEGRFSDRGDIQETTLGVKRLDRPGDSIDLGTRIDFDDLDISFSLEAAEAPGGLVSEIAGLPETEALEITAAASGNPDSLPFSIYADIGQIGIADGEGVAQWKDSIAVTFNGEVSPGDKTAGRWRNALGDAARLKLDAEQTDSGGYLLNQFQIDSEAFGFQGKGAVDTTANTIDLAFDWSAKKIDALNAVIAPARVGALTGKATAIGALNAPKVDVDAVVRDLTAGFGSIDAMDLRINSQPQSDTSSQTQRFSFAAKTDGLALKDDALQQALGETPSFSGNGAFFGAENRVALETVQIAAKTVDLEGNADYDLSDGSLNAELTGAATNLGPFMRAAGLPVDGAADLALKIKNLTNESVERLFLNAQLSQLSSEDRNYAAIIGETAVLEALLVEADPGIVKVERGFFESATLRTEAKGQFSIPSDSVDLELDWRLKDAERIAPVIEPTTLGGAEGKAILEGKLSEPKVDIEAVVTDIDSEGYGASSAEVTSSLQMRKDLRAPFSMTTKLEGFRAPDPTLAALVGPEAEIKATGIYDTATSLLTLSDSAAAIAAGDFTLKGDVHLRKQTLDAAYTLKSRDLAALGEAADVEMNGIINAEGTATGPFTAPLVSTRADIRNLDLYGYSVDAMDLDLTTEPANEDGDVPFQIDMTASNPSLGDADLDALIGTAPKIVGSGTFNPVKKRASIESFSAELSTINATASGDVDVQNSNLDLNFDLDASDLSGLSGLIGTEMTGAIKAGGSAKGSFFSPEIDIDLDGNQLRYGDYRVGEIAGRLDVKQALIGYAPFDVDVIARDVDLGDPSLNDLIGPRAEIKAKGEFNQLAKALRLESARFDVAAAKGTASGSVDLSNENLDLTYDIDVDKLQPIGDVAGLDLAGSVAAKGSAKGSFTAPQVDTTIQGKNLRYENYAVDAVNGTIDIKQSPTGFAPFNIDVEATGVDLGDPSLNALIGPRAEVTAKGAFNQSEKALRLESAWFDIAAGNGTASGSVNLAKQTMDMVYDVDVSELEPIGDIAGVNLAGAIAAKGSAKGTFTAPEIDTTLQGRGLRYENYAVDAVNGTIDIKQSPTGFAPFNIDVEATGVDLGDPSLNALIGPRAEVTAKGAFNQSEKALRLESARFDIAAGNGTASGSVNLAEQTMDMVYDVDVSELEPIGDIAGVNLAGAIAAKGSAKGTFTAPEVDTTLQGRGLRYENYAVDAIKGTIDIMQSPTGFAPFNIDVEATGVDLGDPSLNALIGPRAEVTAKGAFNQSEKALRLDKARFDIAAGNGTASGSVNLAEQTMDMVYDVDVSELEPIGDIAGVDLAGAIAAKGSAKGTFTAPEVDTTLQGRGLRYENYAVDAINGAIDIKQSPTGFAPFNIDVEATGVDLGDPSLNALIGPRAEVTANGAFNQSEKALRLEGARFDIAAGNGTASGSVNLAEQTMDMVYDVDVSELKPIGDIAGVNLSGAIAAKGSAKGTFTAPEIDTTLQGRGLRYENYAVDAVNGTIDIKQSPTGFAPFNIDVEATGFDLGDPALTDLIGDKATIKSSGAYNQADQILRIDRAGVTSAAATANANGSINIGKQTLDVDFALDAATLSPLRPILKTEIAGALSATGSIGGSFAEPALRTKLNGTGLRYDKYRIADVNGSFDVTKKSNGASPFDIDVTASGLDSGDPNLNNALGSTASIAATGDYNLASQALGLDSARVITDAAQIAASGKVNPDKQTLDIAYDIDAKDLTLFSAIAGNGLGGALKSSGRASGSFTAPQINANLNGQSLRYGPYSIAQINGRIDVAQGVNGPAPFDIDVTASGIDLGDPNLTNAVGSTAAIVAKGSFDQSAQILTLASASATTNAARASASGTVNLKAQTLDVSYDVDAGNLGAFAQIAGADIGGSLSAKGRAVGPFVTPAVNTTLSGRELRYGIYSVGSVDGQIEVPQSSAGLAPFNVDVRASAISTGDAALDALIGDTALIRANGRIDQQAQILELTDAVASTRTMTAGARGRVDLGNQQLDVAFEVDAADIAPATGLVGKSVGGKLQATGTAKGPFTAPILNLDAVGSGLFYDKYSVGQLSLNLTMDSTNGNVTPFTLATNAFAPRIGNPQIEALLGETVTVDARGTLDQKALLLRLDDATVRASAGAARVAGLVDIPGKQLDVGYSAHLPALGALQPLVGQTISGDLRVDGRALGGFDDLDTSGILVGSGVVFQTYEFSSVVASYDLKNLLTGPRGGVSLDGQTPFGPVTANAGFDLSGGSLRIDRLMVNGLGIDLDGTFETLPGGLYAGDARLNATDLSALGQFVGQDIAGSVNGTVSLNGQDHRQNAVFDLNANNVRYAQLATIGTVALKGSVIDALNRDPYLNAEMSATSAVVSGFAVNQIAVNAIGNLSALRATVNASGGETGSDKLQTTGIFNLINVPRGAQIYTLGASFKGVQIASASQFNIQEIPVGGVRATGLNLRIDDGEVVGDAEYTPNGLVAKLRVRNVPMKLTQLAGIDLIQSGRLFGDMDIDTRGAPRGSFMFNANVVRLKGAQLNDPFDFSASGTLDGQAMDIVATASSGIINQPFKAIARIPLKQLPGVPVPVPDQFAPFSASMDWQGDVAEFWAFVPAPDHVLSGPVVINGRADGTLSAPRLEGGAVLTGGRYQNLEFGTLLDQINMTGNFTQDGRVVFDLTATDGVRGTVAAKGSYVVANGTIDAGINLNQAALVRRDDATAVLSGEATARSEGQDIAVRGAFRTDFVELRLIGGFGGSVIVVDAIPVGETAPRFNPPSESGPTQRISLDVSLDFPQQVFVRGRGLDSEWGGRIRATGFASDPQINGLIERRRGWLDLLGRQFELAIGEVRFTGPLDPFIRVRLQRASNDITGWLDVTGPASDIELEFGSIPALPPDEVLPRLLFGRSKQSLSAIEAAQLAAGVATLLSGKAGALDAVRGALGVDVLRVEGGDGDGATIATGKYLTEDIFVGGKQNLETGGTSAFVEIEVFENFEIEGEFGEDEAEGSASWKLDY